MDYEKLSNLAISDTGFVFNPSNGDSFTLNPTARFILKLLKEGKNKQDILNSIVENYEVTKDEAEIDYENFINQLNMYKLI